MLADARWKLLLQDCKDGSSELLSSTGVDDGIQAAVAYSFCQLLEHYRPMLRLK